MTLADAIYVDQVAAGGEADRLIYWRNRSALVGLTVTAHNLRQRLSPVPSACLEGRKRHYFGASHVCRFCGFDRDASRRIEVWK